MLRRTVLTAALAGVLALPAVAHANAYDDVLADYQSDERITACDHGGPKLLEAKALTPPTAPPGFSTALEKAIARAGEGCDEDAAGTQLDQAATTAAVPTTPTTPGTPTTPPATTPVDPATGAVPTTPPAGTTPGTPAPVDPNATAAAPATEDDDGGLPPAAIAGIAAGVLLLLALLVWGLARFFAWDPVWLARTRHTIAEAGWRTSGMWEDFADWLRGGRPRRS